MIPLMMESGYTPDGWLGIVLGSKLWMDFRKEPTVGIQQLVKEIAKGEGSISIKDVNWAENPLVTDHMPPRCFYVYYAEESQLRRTAIRFFRFMFVSLSYFFNV